MPAPLGFRELEGLLTRGVNGVFDVRSSGGRVNVSMYLSGFDLIWVCTPNTAGDGDGERGARVSCLMYVCPSGGRVYLSIHLQCFDFDFVVYGAP